SSQADAVRRPSPVHALRAKAVAAIGSLILLCSGSAAQWLQRGYNASPNRGLVANLQKDGIGKKQMPYILQVRLEYLKSRSYSLWSPTQSMRTTCPSPWM